MNNIDLMNYWIESSMEVSENNYKKDIVIYN